MLQTTEKTSYPGGKAGSGVYQKIINLMPPHRVYVEGFLGGGSIMRIKRPAAVNIGVEIDYAVYLERAKEWPSLAIIHTDFLEWLKFSDVPNREGVLIYLDPPYLMSTRSTKRPIYDHEFHTEAEHAALLSAILPLSDRVMISGYPSQLYDDMLATWRRIEFTGVSRGGPTTEVVWCNFPEPAELHDYRFLGETFRQRQDIRRQKDRWIAKLRAMPSQKRFAILAATDEFKRLDRNGTNADERSLIGTAADSRESADPPSSSSTSAEMPSLAKDGGNADAISRRRPSAKQPSSAASGTNAVAGSRKAK